MDNNHIVLNSKLANALQDLIAAILLHNIIYWVELNAKKQNTKSAYFDGKYWVIRSYSKFREKLLFTIPDKTIRNKLEKLQDMGLIEIHVEKDEFGNYSTRRYTYNKENVLALVGQEAFEDICQFSNEIPGSYNKPKYDKTKQNNLTTNVDEDSVLNMNKGWRTN